MHVAIIGINHKSASLDLREKVAKACKTAFSQSSVVLLSTCNRTEIYFSATDLAEMHSELLRCLQAQVSEPFEHALYSYFGKECFHHLAHVVCGLDSALIGESDIQRQVKVAYLASPKGLASELHYLFQKSLQIGKRMRTAFSLFRQGATLEGVLWDLIRSLLPSPARLLFVGNSEINRKIIRLFAGKGSYTLHLATRTPASAEAFALDYGVHLSDWSALFSWQQFDGLICGTDCTSRLIHANSGSLRTRVAIDLGVPRNIDPLLAKRPDLTLFNIEQIGALLEQKKQVLQSDVVRLSSAIEESVDRALYSYLCKKEAKCALSC